MTDSEAWWRLLRALLDGVYPDDIVGEREAVQHFHDLHDLLTNPNRRIGDQP